MQQLGARFDEVASDPRAKAIVIQGAGKAFVAGADIRYFFKHIKADRIEDVVAFTRRGHALQLKIENSAKPTIALLEGLSMGGGSELTRLHWIFATADALEGLTSLGRKRPEYKGE